FIILFFSNDTTTPEIYTLSYTTLFRSVVNEVRHALGRGADATQVAPTFLVEPGGVVFLERLAEAVDAAERGPQVVRHRIGEGLRSEEHTSELQSRGHLVCRLLLEKKKK